MSACGGPAHYEVRVEGVLDSRWAAWFGGLQVEGADTQTVISGLLADQPVLHGLLAKIGDLGLCLISLRRLDSDEPETGKVRRLHPRRPRPNRESPCLLTALCRPERPPRTVPDRASACRAG